MRPAYPAGVYRPLAKFSKKTETNMAPIVTRTIARPFAAGDFWEAVVMSLRSGVVIVVIVRPRAMDAIPDREYSQVEVLAGRARSSTVGRNPVDYNCAS